jgi:hypothetical protein
MAPTEASAKMHLRQLAGSMRDAILRLIDLHKCLNTSPGVKFLPLPDLARLSGIAGRVP